MQDHSSSPLSPAPAHDAETWQAYWKQKRQPWRSEPPIDEERQQLLANCLQGSVAIERGKYPFRGMRLSRADVEWLLAAAEERSARESTSDGHSRKPPSLDVRGADLSGVQGSGCATSFIYLPTLFFTPSHYACTIRALRQCNMCMLLLALGVIS